MICKNNFNIMHYREIFSKALELEYKIITCFDYFKHNYNENEKRNNELRDDILKRFISDVPTKKK